jgi:hypothetical protein
MVMDNFGQDDRSGLPLHPSFEAIVIIRMVQADGKRTVL